ncbi:MAG: tetratricopeptide repeat protein, partial [Candidatus Muiribacteriaceae bacterium]
EKALRLSPNNSLFIRKKEEIMTSRDNAEKAEELYDKAKRLYRVEKYLQAVKAVSEALDIVPNSINNLEAYWLILNSYRKLDMYEKQIATAKEILENDSTDIKVWIYLAEAYYFSGDYENALIVFERINDDFSEFLAEYPGISSRINSRIRDLKMRQYIPVLKKSGYAAGILLILLFLFFNTPVVRKVIYYRKARTAFLRKSWNEIIEYGEPIMKYSFSHYKRLELYKMMILAYIQVRDFEHAERLLKEAMGRWPDDEELLYNNAVLFLKRDVFSKEALYAYKVFFQKEPYNRRLLRMIARYFWERKRNPDFRPVIDIFEEKKMEILERVFNNEKDNLEVVNLLADEYRKGQVFNRNSLKVFEKLLEHDYENIQVHELLSRAYLACGEYEKAVKECKFIFRRDINNISAHDVFRKSYIGSGNIDQLLIEYENLLQIDPDNRIIRDNIIDLRRIRSNYRDVEKNEVVKDERSLFDKARDLFYANELNESITLFNDLFADGYRKEDSGFFLTYAYLKKGLIDLAYKQYKMTGFDEELLQKRLKELIYQLGNRLEEKGENEKALEMYDKICRIDISYRDVFERYEELALGEGV